MKQNHFRFEAKLMIWLAIVLLALIFIVGAALPWLRHHLDIDKCLDAGGAYDYQNEVCIGSKGN